MKVQIEIQEKEDGDVLNATFSLVIVDMKVSSLGSLKELPEMIKNAYLNFYKLRNSEIPNKELAEFMNYIDSFPCRL